MTLLSDAFTAYLGPLLKMHSAGQALHWEDLEVSRVASTQVMKLNSDNSFVSKRVEDLHQSQVQAYREAAVKALREWAQSAATLEPMEENDTEDAFVQRCVGAVASQSWPTWRLDSGKTVVVMEIRKRARATYAKYHPQDGDDDEEEGGEVVPQSYSHDDDGNDDNDDGEVEEEEDGEMNDDGEVDGLTEAATAAATSSNGAQKAATNTGIPPKKAIGIASAKNNNKKKKVIVRKKSTAAKQPIGSAQQRKGGASNRGRRGGRAGGNTKSG